MFFCFLYMSNPLRYKFTVVFVGGGPILHPRQGPYKKIKAGFWLFFSRTYPKETAEGRARGVSYTHTHVPTKHENKSLKFILQTTQT